MESGHLPKNSNVKWFLTSDLFEVQLINGQDNVVDLECCPKFIKLTIEIPDDTEYLFRTDDSGFVEKVFHIEIQEKKVKKEPENSLLILAIDETAEFMKNVAHENVCSFINAITEDLINSSNCYYQKALVFRFGGVNMLELRSGNQLRKFCWALPYGSNTIRSRHIPKNKSKVFDFYPEKIHNEGPGYKPYHVSTLTIRPKR